MTSMNNKLRRQAYGLPVFIALMPTLLLTTMCYASPGWQGSLESLLNSQPERFATVSQNPEKHRVQIIYTRIDRDKENQPTFQSFTYRVNPDEYFYPASTVKLPTVALALEKLHRLNQANLNRDTTMLTTTAADFQTAALVDETSPTGLPSIGHYASKILLVSDNDAFNRLYEFLGQQDLNQSLLGKGYSGTRIVHRLEVGLSQAQNRWTNPLQFMQGAQLIYAQADVRAEQSFIGTRPQPLGLAEMVNGERLERPKDFADKNAFSIQDQHAVVKSLLFPQSMPAENRFDISDDDYNFIRRYMAMYPGESGIEAYQNAQRYPQGYVKFFIYGGDEKLIPAHIRIFNKVGDAYGFLTDTAYIVDFRNKVEFLLSATIYTNENRTFNDDDYEYDEIGLPFLKNLGQAIYEIELARPRQYRPDLSDLPFSTNDH